MNTVRGYHTLKDKGNASQIELNGPIKCILPSRAWLGLGYYFWDTEIKWAHQWGVQYGEYLIFEALLRIDGTTFDLFGNVSHINEFLECIKIIMAQKPKDSQEVLVPEVIEYIKAHTKFETIYNSIRCADYPNSASIIRFRKDKPEETYLGGSRVQHCLLNKNNIVSQSFKVVYPENL